MRPLYPALLLAASLIPATALATPHGSADVPPASVRITTGVATPVVLNAGAFSISQDALQSSFAEAPFVVLALHVDEKGAPSDVRVVKSLNPKVDGEVMAAARAFHFRPAMLDREAIPVDLRLTVQIQR